MVVVRKKKVLLWDDLWVLPYMLAKRYIEIMCKIWVGRCQRQRNEIGSNMTLCSMYIYFTYFI